MIITGGVIGFVSYRIRFSAWGCLKDIRETMVVRQGLVRPKRKHTRATKLVVKGPG